MISTPPPSDPADHGAPATAAEAPAQPVATPDDQVKWPIWAAPAAIAMGFGVGVFASVIVGAIASVNGSSLSHPSPAVALISDVLFDLAFVGSAIFFSRVRGRPSWADFGFRRVGVRLAVVSVVVTAISYYVVTAVYASLFNLRGSDRLPKELGVSNSTAALVGATVFVCVIAPIVEEFFFRGFIFGALRQMRIVIAGRNIGTWVAAIVTGILFGLAHTGSASSQYLVPLGFLGFVLCLLRWRTGSLYPCMALHSINNSLALGIGQLHWNAAEIIGLMIGSLLVIGSLTLPLAGRKVAISGLGPAQ
jgi:membrane protease YdiL (CAAX protease family)